MNDGDTYSPIVNPGNYNNLGKYHEDIWGNSVYSSVNGYFEDVFGIDKPDETIRDRHGKKINRERLIKILKRLISWFTTIEHESIRDVDRRRAICWFLVQAKHGTVKGCAPLSIEQYELMRERLLDYNGGEFRRTLFVTNGSHGDIEVVLGYMGRFSTDIKLLHKIIKKFSIHNEGFNGEPSVRAAERVYKIYMKYNKRAK